MAMMQNQTRTHLAVDPQPHRRSRVLHAVGPPVESDLLDQLRLRHAESISLRSEPHPCVPSGKPLPSMLDEESFCKHPDAVCARPACCLLPKG